ncbi:UNVERIFIED_ORG: small-conductance mechanosensitive channel [Zoogloea ramigera]|uniref:Mechanosensitive ion channel n=1 Tax=Duganella zoogloeoides TaxID=75659 RepID=A0ABZ0XVY3_9BURK|nr:mechanosensitive ion channel domain-containing protein [Duganella zoogloeoides]WQH03386.1 mechanosensitive ion channel [Duganella zoogloeoides]
MELEYFTDLQQGPWRAAAVVAITAVIFVAIALVLHRAGIELLKRIARHRPYTTNAVKYAFRPSQLAAVLFALRLVLTGAPETTPFLASLSRIVSVLLIVCLTWLAIACVNSIKKTISDLNPVDVLDNMRARRVLTQTSVLTRSANAIIVLLGLGFMLLTLPGARQFGASLLASAGVAGLVAGIAAKPVLGNFIAGLQIAFSQPIRIDDVLIVKGEWGRVERITGTYVVVRIWDERRMIVPLQWFIENPFENWTHTSASILGTVFLWLDFSVPVQKVRAEFERITHASTRWDKRVCVLHVTDANEKGMQLRLLVSAVDSGTAFDLRCEIREAMIAFVAANYPDSLPRLRPVLDSPGPQDDTLGMRPVKVADSPPP